MNNEIKYGRKRKGIRMELKKKVEEWLESIEDIDVQTVARRDVIVTGGSIASMLLGEQVNDYDVYFRNHQTTKVVAQYYVDQFNKKNSLKTSAGVTDYKPEVRTESLVNVRGETENRVIIFMKSAGVASEEQSEYSYFESMGQDAAAEFVASTVEDIHSQAIDPVRKKFRPVFLSENAITLSDKFQIVVRFYGEPNEIHDNYDFVHATCYWDHANEVLELPAEAMEALLSRTLVYRGSLYPVASIFRTKKFLERGWRITAGQQLKIMWQISELDLSNYEVLREQLTGVDMAYMYELVQALKDVDPSKINSTYVSAIIDKIFD